MFLIYCITNRVNGKRYIGQTSRTTVERWWEHQSAARCGQDTYLYRAIRKHGVENFYLKDLDRTETNELANQLEMFWIQTLGTNIREYGYNGDAGGLGYYQPSEETLRKRSESIKQGYRNGRVAWCARTDITDSLVADLYLSGLSQRQIAKQLNTSKRTVASRLEKLSIPQRSVKDYKYKISAETRKRMSEAKLADPLTVERCRKMTRERLEGRN